MVMRRRTFLGLSTAGCFFRHRSRAAARQLDRFGGWKAKRFRATGFFRIEKEERWWLVIPDGHAFLRWGINHLYPDLWKQEYNREAWKKTLGMEKLSGPPSTLPFEIGF